MDEFGWFLFILFFAYFIVDVGVGLGDDEVRLQTVHRAEERCIRNDGLRYFDQTGGLVGMSHRVVCNDGAEFKIPRTYNEGLTSEVQ